MFTNTITNAPHVPRARAVLDARAMIENPVGTCEKYRKELGPTFTLHLGGTRPVIVSTSPSFVHHTLQTNKANYRMSEIRVKRMVEFQGHGLPNSQGDEWFQRRRHMSKGFRRDRLSALLSPQQQLIEELLSQADAEAERGPVDMMALMTRLIHHVVARSVFGSRMTDAEIAQIGSGIKAIQAFIVRQIVQPYMIPWFRLSGQSRRYQQLRLEGDRIARDYITTHAERSGDDGGDVLDLLLHAPFGDTGTPMSTEQILIESMQLLVAGYQTSTASLAWTFHLLGQHPEFVAEMREEVDATFGTGPITFEGIGQLRLTRRVLDEAMRLYPSFWMIDRVANGEDEIDGIRIPAGLMCITYIYGLHRNPDVWPNPDTFDPGRFEDEARRGRHPAAHLPFGGGPRKCIGSNMALIQMLTILALFVRRYDIEPVGDGKVEFDAQMTLHPKNPIQMRLQRLSRGGAGSGSRPAVSIPRQLECPRSR
jgi:cytochrome P450